MYEGPARFGRPVEGSGQLEGGDDELRLAFGLKVAVYILLVDFPVECRWLGAWVPGVVLFGCFCCGGVACVGVVVGLVVGVWVGVGWLKVAVLIWFAGILFACSLVCV